MNTLHRFLVSIVCIWLSCFVFVLLFSHRALADSISPSGLPGANLTTDVQQQLTNAMWQAPLAILTIVVGIGALFGYAAYQDILKNITAKFEKAVGDFEKEFSQDLSDQSLLSICRNQLNEAWFSWELALDLVKESGYLNYEDLPDITLKIQQQLPPRIFLWIRSALPHVRFAKHLLERSLDHFNSISDAAKSLGRPKKYFLLETKQSYAYYVATDFVNSKQGEWSRALEYSQEAFDQRYIIKTLDISESRKSSIEENWIDTYFYVRVVYRLKDPNPDADQLSAFDAAVKAYKKYVQDSDANAAPRLRFAQHLSGTDQSAEEPPIA